MNTHSTVARSNGMPLFCLPLRRMLVTLLLIAGIAAVARAQAHLQSWMEAPRLDANAEVWFRRTLSVSERPVRAWITVATTDRYDLYVNGRNVSRCVRLPLRPALPDDVIATTHNIAPFLRSGENTILIAAAPTYLYKGTPAVSATVWGDYPSGASFLSTDAKEWLVCQGGRSLLKDGGERQDATKDFSPSDDNSFVITRWLPVGCTKIPEKNTVRYSARDEEGERIVHVCRPRYFNTVGDTITYDFGNAFHGFLRVTLRGCRRGEHINVGGQEYICSGEEDEQAFRRWTTTDLRRITITGDKYFRRDQIQSVEAVELGTRPHSADFR